MRILKSIMNCKLALDIHHVDKMDNDKTKLDIENLQTASFFQVARHIFSETNTQQHLLVTTKASRIEMIKPRVLPTSRQLTLGAK